MPYLLHCLMLAAVPLAADAGVAREGLRIECPRPVAPANPLTPLMGWSSWNTFAEHISEDIILGVAQAMATNGLKDAGYVYVNIDDGFFNGHGPDGRLRPCFFQSHGQLFHAGR